MHEPRALTGRELADLCKGRLLSPQLTSSQVIRTVSTLIDAGDDAVSWIAGNRHTQSLAASKAAIIVGSEKLLCEHPRGLVVTDPELAIAEILDFFFIPLAAPAPGVHPSAVVHPTVKLEANAAVGAHAALLEGVHIGANSVIHEGVSLGRNVRVGRDTVIYDRVVVYDRCELGDRVIIHSGAIIGADGFGYIFRNGQHRKTAHIGTVIIEDDVEIGANSCVDRAKIGATRIGRGTKIDNLVQVAHNVQMGPLCLLAGQTGISGSVRIGSGVAMGGQTGITDGLNIGDGAQIAATSGVFADVEADEVVFGTPAQNKTAAMRDQARVRRLARLFEQVTELSRRVAELEAAADHPKHD
ncbi:MAG TPA: UDP-3-O-(3-hydroxymyristoyl)glucosamine N-acyltransferase [Phycisphaerae bacterium]|nr:UDP-3-O-(3-hydroxymyristoyl)glucosamine N-acyltransferase [Phycisphaerae bacterium]